MDMATIDLPTLLTSLIALAVSIGGAAVLNGRKKFLTVVVKMAGLMVAFADALGDDQITQTELDDLARRAREIKDLLK
jgi:hypothetical protein